LITVEDYLAGEAEGELRHEYIGGDLTLDCLDIELSVESISEEID